MNQQPGGVAKTSKLTLPGIILLVMGLAIPRPLNELAHQTTNKLVAAILFLGTDAFRLCFFVGLGLLITGGVRNSKWKREAEAARKNSAP